jgi:hypothetical protein
MIWFLELHGEVEREIDICLFATVSYVSAFGMGLLPSDWSKRMVESSTGLVIFVRIYVRLNNPPSSPFSP